jgi:hypothetical protein
VAQAALGNTLVEGQFIDAVRDAEKNLPPAPKNHFYDVGPAKDGTELARRLRTLGLIGTRRSLTVVCGYLRSTLKSYVRDISERSVQYTALDALLYNFPDQRILHDPTNLAAWSAAEKFCNTNFGPILEGPTPDIPPRLAYPHR